MRVTLSEAAQRRLHMAGEALCVALAAVLFYLMLLVFT
jgi:hypothetical protein